jgi:hypothetical protein
MKRWTEIGVVCALAMTGSRLTAQTRIDLRTQAKSIDFSESTSTKPSKAGTVLPGACTVGEVFFKTNAPAGQNLYACTATGVWSVMAPVTSVFGRVGAVAAQAGDYSFSHISGTASNSQLATGIDAAKIGAGTVGNTVFGYLAGVTQAVQTQLDQKAAASHTHTLAGDVTGQSSDTTVARLQNRAVSTTAPVDGQVLLWSGTTNAWVPATISGSSGTGGVTMANALGDLQAVRTAATTLGIGSNCSASLPCNVRFGNLTTQRTAGASVQVSAGTGDAYVYMSPPGTLVVGHSGLTLSCSNCTVLNGVTAFPADALPLWRWHAGNGTWDSSGVDFRAFLGTKTVQAGTGLLSVEVGGQTTMAVDSALVGLRVASPASSNTTCEVGQWAIDTSYEYLCIASSTWRRVALSSW